MQHSSTKPPLRVGVIGYGTVGRALVQILETMDWVNVTAIGVRNTPDYCPIGIRVFHNVSQLIRSSVVDVVVEVTNDSVASLEFLREAFQCGKPFVTANKKLVAESLLEIHAQRTEGHIVLYEAAVCASIPVLRSLATSWSTEQCTSVRGIVNGTTNVILERMSVYEQNYEQALKYAQEHGFAERDADADVSGQDAARKLSILCFHAFGTWLPSDTIPRVGIQGLTHDDIAFFAAREQSVKLIANATTTGRGLRASVLPTAVASSNAYSSTTGEQNFLELQWQYAAAQTLQGAGAGGIPTASAIIGDILATTRYEPYVVRNVLHNGQHANIHVLDEVITVYVRVRSEIGRNLHWDSIDTYEELGNWSRMTGTISVRELSEFCKDYSDTAVVRL